jgi:hypothetical protein
VGTRKPEFAIAWEQVPWWRALSLTGWGVFFLAVFSTASFFLGLVSGEVLFLLSFKQKSGPLAVSYQVSPVGFLVCMAFNLIIAVGLWWLFASWLQSRRRAIAGPAGTENKRPVNKHKA